MSLQASFGVLIVSLFVNSLVLVQVANAQTPATCANLFRADGEGAGAAKSISPAVTMRDFDLRANTEKLEATYALVNQTLETVLKIDLKNARYENVVRPVVAALGSFYMYEELSNTVSLLKTFASDEAVLFEKLEARGSELKNKVQSQVYGSAKLYRRFERVLQNETLPADRRIVVEKMLADFRASGIGLPARTLRKIEAIKTRLSDLQIEFRKHYQARLKTKVRLPRTTRFASYAPMDRLAAALKLGDDREYVFTLAPDDVNQTHFVLQFAEDGEVRRQFFRKFASVFRGPLSNRAIVAEVVRLRAQLAGILGEKNFAATVLPTQMIGTEEDLKNFIDVLEKPYVELVRSELKGLQQMKQQDVFAAEDKTLRPWDVQYYAKAQELKELNGRSIEDATPYLEFKSSLAIALRLIGDFYHLDFIRVPKLEKWHEDVRGYEVRERDGGRLLGYMYLDILARSEKPKGGAFMSNFVPAGEVMALDGSYTREIPVVVANANIPKAETGPTFIPFRSLQSVMHEIGHAVHGLAYTGEAAIFSGVFGHATIMDFVELPSQLLENWLYTPEVLKQLGRHYQTGLGFSDKFINEVILRQRAQVPGLRTLGRRGLMTRYDYQLHTLSADQSSALESGFDVARYLASANAEWREFAYLQAITRVENNAYLFMHDYQVKFHGYQYSEANEATVFSMAMANGLSRAPEIGLRFRSEVLSRGSLGDQNGDMSALFRQFTGSPTNPADILKKYR